MIYIGEYIMLREKVFKNEPEAEVELGLIRIENLKKNLDNLIDYHKGLVFTDEIIEMSQYLDNLIVAHIKNTRRE